MKEKHSLAIRMICLIAGARLSKVLLTDEKIVKIEPLDNRQDQPQLFNRGHLESSIADIIAAVTLRSLCWSGSAFAPHGRRRWSSSKKMAKSTLPAIRRKFC
ncbi:hypothetical protein KIN20_028161 [Parelaphostrongylus tenuis]|uniref:Uncharacterized protein n=1 Tax=Parelaphostrongylus tenuis TaxID=148309 RepID=A0AAD5WEF4_PARTN|nr:hypothetical protein KIN20_028161 [Parelaphostrongylus tenuis]